MSVSTASTSPTAGAATPGGPVAIWLFLCCAMIFVMVVLGGVTRLTHSGLSIVEWRPLMGWIPPLSDAAWLEVFQKYQATPEYQQINHGMTLGAFKGIFWMEYLHRLWGRAIGIVFFVPFIVFAALGRIERRLWPALGAIFLLGAFQGLLGWIMVRSGLVDRPDVSPYLLAAHLGTAFAIYAFTFWMALQLSYAGARDRLESGAGRLAPFAYVLVCLVFVTVLAGAMVAGTDAGFAFNTFPLMDGQIVPGGLFDLHPWYRNFVENIETIQFTHRVLAITTFALVLGFWFYGRRRLAGAAGFAANVFAALAIVQVALGISTLLLVVPIPLAAAHQAGALALFTAALWTANRLAAARR